MNVEDVEDELSWIRRMIRVEDFTWAGWMLAVNLMLFRMNGEDEETLDFWRWCFSGASMCESERNKCMFEGGHAPEPTAPESSRITVCKRCGVLCNEESGESI